MNFTEPIVLKRTSLAGNHYSGEESLTDEKASVVFDKVNYVLHRIDYGCAAASHAEFKGYAQVGSYRTMSTVEMRRVVIVGYIFAADAEEMSERQRLLARVTSPLGEFELIKGKHKLTCAAISTPHYSTDPALTGDCVARFTLSAVCHFPCWTNTSASVGSYTRYEGHLIFPKRFDESGVILGVRKPAFTIRTYNYGDIECGGVFSIKTDLPLTYAEMRNNNKGEFFRINKNISAGETIVIDTRYGKKRVVSITSSGLENIMGALDWESSFMQIPIGETVFDIAVGGNSGGVTVDLEFSSMYF